MSNEKRGSEKDNELFRFPSWHNIVPPIFFLVVGPVATILAIGGVWYYFSPKFTDVGYMPEQPVHYSHKLHAGTLGMDCRYCHRTVEESYSASVPDADTCYGCHKHVKTDSLALQPLRDVFSEENWEKDQATPIEWVKVHLLPQFAYFNHAVHMRANVGCKSCHGRVDQMEIVRQAEPLSMGWCLDCHRDAAPHIRPDGVKVTDMTWEPTDDSIKAAQKLLAWDGDSPPSLGPTTHHSSCHR